MEAAVAVLVDHRSRTLVLLRPETTNWAPGKWGYPGGRIECDETPVAAAVRETLEETTLRILNLRPVKLEIGKPVAIYYTRDFSGTTQIDHEHDDWRWVTREQLRRLDTAPEVVEIFDWVLKNE